MSTVLAPPAPLLSARVGEFYGLYSMVGRFAAVVGPALRALIADTLGMGRPAAVGGLLVLVVIGFWILRGVDDRPREWGEEDQYSRAASGPSACTSAV
jgi:MFS-type transporter involved in bile tolerance (Atg22 family)